MKKIVFVLICALGCATLTSCGPIRSYWGIESDYGYDSGHHKPHKKPKPPKHPKHPKHHADWDD